MSQQSPNQDRWFADEVQPHEPALRSYLRSRASDVDDLAQESYMRVLSTRKAGPIDSAKAYLFAPPATPRSRFCAGQTFFSKNL